jgi:hypothetical protein
MKQKKNLQELFKKTGIHAELFREALGMPVNQCSATTIDEAHEIHDAARINSARRRAAFIRWSELSLKEVLAATTFKEAWEAHERTPPNSEVERIAFARCVELCTTTEAIMSMCDNTPDGSEAKRALLTQWNEISLRDVADAKTHDEIVVVYDNAPDGSEAKRAAFAKWIRLCTTIDEAHIAYDNAIKGSEAEKAALRKIHDLF